MFNKKLRQSIGFKFLIIVSVILLASTVVLSILISVNERAMLRHSLQNKGNDLASYIAKLGKDPLVMKDRIELDMIVNQAIKSEEVLYAVIQDASGNLLTSQYASIDYRWPGIKDIVSVLPRDSKVKDIIATIRMQGGGIEVSTPITYDGDTIGKVTLGMSQHKINQQVVKTIIFVVVVNLVVTFIIGAILFIASKKLILDPITELAHAVTRFTKGELRTRLEIKTTGEMLALVESFNLMMEDMGKAIVSKDNELAERKRAEAALLESEVLFRKLFEDHVAVKLIIDPDTGNIIDANESAAVFYGWSREQLKQMKIQEINTLPPEEVKKEMEQVRTEKKMQFEFRHRRADGSVRDVQVFSSKIETSNKTLLHSIIQDTTERKRAEEKLRETFDSLRKAVGTTIQVMVSAVERRDPYTAGHQLRSTNLARAIATEMGLSQDTIEAIRMAGPIHDIGKISIPAEILSKPTKLTNIEFSLIKEHARTGYEMLKDVESPWPLAEIVYQHHERIDGSGYPRNLKGDNILMEARILAVADVVEAMASHRPYRPAIGLNAALAEIENNKGTLYDADAVDVCLRLFREKGFHFEGA